MTKKKVLAIAGVLSIAALVLSAGTLAYFTDTDKATNTFTIGNVDITLLESKFHRVNAGETTATRLSWDTTVEGYAMNGAAGSAPADAHGWTKAYYTDDQIKADAEKYQSEYLAEAGQKLVPGANVMKAPYVVNNGSVDAYVRVRVLVPAELDNGILGNSMYTGTAISSGDTTLATTNNLEKDGIIYNQYAFTYVDPVKAGKMTFWNVWGDIKLSENVTQEQIVDLKSRGFLTSESKFNVLIEADAIQADGFADATAAFAAFDAQH